MSPNAGLLLIALVAVLGLILLIARFKLNAFIALMLASLFVGVCSGMKLSDVPKSFLEGSGKVLGDIAVVIGLGSILGKMLAESGGAQVVADRLIGALGEKNLHWAMMFIAFLVGIPVFFAVGLVLLVPILFTVARETKTPLLRLGIPLVAGLSVVHGLVPPHPGPVAAMGIFNDLAGRADMGKTILYSLLIGLPTAIVAGPLFGQFVSGRVDVELRGVAEQLAPATRPKAPPSFPLTVLTILLPVLLMLGSTVANLFLPKEHSLRVCADFAGHPAVAMLAASAPGVHLELVIIAMGAGSLILSHVNDGGFWFVKEYFNMTVPQTLQTWTVMETIISVVALILVSLLDMLV